MGDSKAILETGVAQKTKCATIEIITSRFSSVPLKQISRSHLSPGFFCPRFDRAGRTGLDDSDLLRMGLRRGGRSRTLDAFCAAAIENENGFR